MAKRKITRKLKKKQSRKKPSLLFKPIRTPVVLLILFFILPIIFFSQKKSSNVSPSPSASPIRYLIATLSAQNQPIKIDPGFSYQEEKMRQEAPIRLVIPEVGIDVSVVEARIVEGFWEIATSSASFGLGSAYPDQIGNTVIFAHAKPGLFAELAQVQKETRVYLFTQSRWFVYQVTAVKTVLPDQVEVVSPTKEKTLTLYTCTGYQDAHRLVVVAKQID